MNVSDLERAEGYDAYRAGVHRDDCPYAERSLKSLLWLEGWAQAYWDKATMEPREPTTEEV